MDYRLAWCCAAALGCGPVVVLDSMGDAGDGTGAAPGDGDDGDAPTTATATATGGVDDNACALEPDPGFCNAAFEHWYFDPVTGTCESFIYGGCDGVVPFQTRADCEASCLSCAEWAQPELPAAEPFYVVVVNDRPDPIYVIPYQFTDDPIGYRDGAVFLRDLDGELMNTPRRTTATSRAPPCSTPGATSLARTEALPPT